MGYIHVQSDKEKGSVLVLQGYFSPMRLARPQVSHRSSFQPRLRKRKTRLPMRRAVMVIHPSQANAIMAWRRWHWPSPHHEGSGHKLVAAPAPPIQKSQRSERPAISNHARPRMGCRDRVRIRKRMVGIKARANIEEMRSSTIDGS